MKVHEFVAESGKIGNPEEEVKYREVIEELKRYPEPEEIWTIANIDLINAQIDLLIIKKNGLIIVDFKNIPDKKGATVEIIGNEMGNWKVKDKKSGEVKELYDNYLSQLRREYLALTKFLLNHIPKFKKVLENGEKSIHILDVLCFNEGAMYDPSQIIDRGILNTFKVATPSTIGRIVSDYDSNQYLLTKEYIEQILNLFKVESLDFEEELNKLWKSLPESPIVSEEECESMKYKKLHEKFQRLCGKIPSDDIPLRAACEHGLALTVQEICDTPEKLKEVFEKYYPEYKGKASHDLIEDIMRYEGYCEIEVEDEEYMKFIKRVYDDVISDWSPERKYDLYIKMRSNIFSYSYDGVYARLGRDLYKYYPNDFCINYFAYIYYLYAEKDYKKAGEIFKNIVTNETFVKNYSIITFDDWYMGDKIPQPLALLFDTQTLEEILSLFDEDLFLDILDSVRSKFPNILSDDEYYNYLTHYHYTNFKKLGKSSEENIDQDKYDYYSKKAIELLENALKKVDTEKRYTLLSRLLEVKLILNNYEVPVEEVDEFYKIIKEMISYKYADAWDYNFYYKITAKWMEKHGKYNKSELIKILKEGIEKYGYNLSLVINLVKEYYESKLYGETMELLENYLKNNLKKNFKETKPTKSSEPLSKDKQITSENENVMEEVIRAFENMREECSCGADCRWSGSLHSENKVQMRNNNKSKKPVYLGIKDIFKSEDGIKVLKLYIMVGKEIKEYERVFFFLKDIEKKYNLVDADEHFGDAYLAYGSWLVEKYGNIKSIREEEKPKESSEEFLRLKDVILDANIKEIIEDIIEDVRDGYSDSILLYGPPGVGKTRLARAIANELGYEFLEITPGDVLSKWVGETEGKIKEYFNKAMQGNVVLFIDEFDGLAMSRDYDYVPEWQISKVNQLMKSIEETLRGSKHLLIIAATNYPEKLDRAVIRRGRFNEKIEIPLPNLEVRKQLWKYYIEKQAKEKRFKIDKIDYDRLAEISEGLSGVDISMLIEKDLWKYIRKRGGVITMGAIEEILSNKYINKNKKKVKETYYIY